MEICYGTQEPAEKTPNGQSWNNLNNKLSEAVMDYNPKYKINIQVHTGTKKLLNKLINMGGRQISHSSEFQINYADNPP